jgi:serine/threonine protein kinase
MLMRSLGSSLPMSNYSKGALLGEGTWGHVFEATRRSDGSKVAIKRIKPINKVVDAHLPQGINFTALREIKYMKEMKGCINIVEVKVSLTRLLSSLILNILIICILCIYIVMLPY